MVLESPWEVLEFDFDKWARTLLSFSCKDIRWNFGILLRQSWYLYVHYVLQEFSANPGRQWLDGLLQSHDGDQQVMSSTSSGRFVDVFRWLHPTTVGAYTNWCTVTGARATNYGCRLDYIFADVGLVPSFVSCDIMADVEGSDHCPVRAEFDLRIIAARKCPQLCTKYFPQFAGRQQTLATFFGKKQHEQPQSSSQEERQSLDEYDCIINEHSSQEHQSASDASSLLGTDDVSSTGVQSVKRRATSDLTDVFSNRDSCGAGLTKKLKPSDNLTNGGNKQSNLLTFFSKRSLPDNTGHEPVISGSQFKVSDTNPTGFMLGQKNTRLSQELTDTAAKLSDGDAASKMWKTLLKGPPQAPLCKGHMQPCVLRTVKKDGPNKGKQFWVCCKPQGHKDNPDARCDHFVWVSDRKC